MVHTKFRTAYALSILVGVLTAFASAAGLFVDGLYRNNLWATSQFRGSDLVRLAIVVPLLFVAMGLARRGSHRALLVWLGILWLTVYDYAFYLFGAAYNELFLVYTALVVLSGLALLFAMPSIDAATISQRFSSGTPVRLISVYLLLVALFLGGLWIFQSVAFIITGEEPQSLEASGHVTEIVFALDLSLLVPGLAIAAIWLWQRRPWGYVLAAMMLVKGTLYPFALLGMGVFAARAGVPDAGDMMPFWLFFAAAGFAASLALFWNLRPNGTEMRTSAGRAVTG